MTLWQAVQGPRAGGDPRAQDRGREMGSVVCPACNNVLMRLYDHVAGIEVYCWVPAASPGHQETRGLGWAMWGVIDTKISDEDHQCLTCWRGHDRLAVTAGDIRKMVATYRRRGRRVRRPAASDDHDNPG
ncbi:hypothetical protein AB0J82_20965 [Asanoa sp. NPDC049518]|uniref:hypothetical protein n=1 Tax=unclassified Asanoa TaxID=2685164 RepID=UPI003438D7BC